MNEPLLILGASARAAALSAARAGFAPLAIDLFADVDLAALCPVVKINDYPAEFVTAAGKLPPAPWLYTGGLENCPAMVDRLAALRPLLGNPGGVLRQVRDPFKVAAALGEARLCGPQVSRSPIHEVPCLRKPRSFSGGCRITLDTERRAAGRQPAVPVVSDAGQTLLDAENRSPRTYRGWYFQEFIEGDSTSAIYFGGGEQAVLLGVTRQLVGEPWTGAGRFQYCGSLGPLDLSSERRASYERIGRCLAARFSLRGIFGVDAIENQAGIWPVEVNPRYTASVEVLERGMSIHAIALHVTACRTGNLPTNVSKPSDFCCGKAVLFATHDITIGDDFPTYISRVNPGLDWPCIADMPRVGTMIQRGQPVISLFSRASTSSETLSKLRALADEVRLLLDSNDLITNRPSHDFPEAPNCGDPL